MIIHRYIIIAFLIITILITCTPTKKNMQVGYPFYCYIDSIDHRIMNNFREENISFYEYYGYYLNTNDTLFDHFAIMTIEDHYFLKDLNENIYALIAVKKNVDKEILQLIMDKMNKQYGNDTIFTYIDTDSISKETTTYQYNFYRGHANKLCLFYDTKTLETYIFFFIDQTIDLETIKKYCRAHRR